MSLTPYRDHDSSFNRNRSSSFSTPTSRNFMYQEMVKIGDSTLIRSYSCGQVFTSGKNGKTFQSTQVSITNFVSPGKSHRRGHIECDPKSWTVPKKLSIAYREDMKPIKAKTSLKFSEPEEGIKHTASDGEWRKYLEKLWRILKKTVYINIIILSILSANSLVKYMHCNQKWRTEDTVKILKQSVFGQEEVISNIRSILTEFGYSNENYVINFSGSTGVGKTYVSSIIYNNFPWEANKHIYFFDPTTEEKLMRKSYSSCGSNLIIIDGMNLTNAEIAINIIENLMMTLNHDEKILVILIFQTRTKSEQMLIKRLTSHIVKVHHISFSSLNQEDVRQCFNVEIRRQNKFVSQIDLNDLVLEQMKFCNISRSFPGCKNVFHEVSRLPYHS